MNFPKVHNRKGTESSLYRRGADGDLRSSSKFLLLRLLSALLAPPSYQYHDHDDHNHVQNHDDVDHEHNQNDLLDGSSSATLPPLQIRIVTKSSIAPLLPNRHYHRHHYQNHHEDIIKISSSSTNTTTSALSTS